MQSFKEAGHLLIPMGNDFHFQQADINYRNMDKAIQTLLRPPPSQCCQLFSTFSGQNDQKFRTLSKKNRIFNTISSKKKPNKYRNR
jgi:hypothetical protein